MRTAFARHEEREDELDLDRDAVRVRDLEGPNSAGGDLLEPDDFRLGDRIAALRGSTMDQRLPSTWQAATATPVSGPAAMVRTMREPSRW